MSSPSRLAPGDGPGRRTSARMHPVSPPDADEWGSARVHGGGWQAAGRRVRPATIRGESRFATRVLHRRHRSAQTEQASSRWATLAARRSSSAGFPCSSCPTPRKIHLASGRRCLRPSSTRRPTGWFSASITSAPRRVLRVSAEVDRPVAVTRPITLPSLLPSLQTGIYYRPTRTRLKQSGSTEQLYSWCGRIQ